MSASTNSWVANDPEQIAEAKKLEIWPLDEHNAALLNEVHPRGYVQSSEIPHEVYDLIAIGAGAGGLVSAKQVCTVHVLLRLFSIVSLTPTVSVQTSPLEEGPRAP
jgi:hypothetical protein